MAYVRPMSADKQWVHGAADPVGLLHPRMFPEPDSPRSYIPLPFAVQPVYTLNARVTFP